MYSGMLITCTTILVILCFSSFVPKALPLVQEIFAEFSVCKKGIETLRNDLIVLENSISTIADCAEKEIKTDHKNSAKYSERLERSSNSASNEVNPTKLDPSNSNSVETTMSGFSDGHNGPTKYYGHTSIDYPQFISAEQNVSINQDWFQVRLNFPISCCLDRKI